MKKLLIPMALAAMIWSACSKENVPDSGSDTPVFMVRFEDSISGPGNVFTAGLGRTYLFTRVERGSDNVLVMSGAFADAGCPAGDCPGSLKFQFRNIGVENFVNPIEIFGSDQSWEYKSPLSDSLALHTVSIQWVTQQGAIFRSEIIPQPQDSSGSSLSHFRILNSQLWEINERGEDTWKMEVDFSCLVFDSLQQEERKIIGSGVIAVGYR